MFEKTMTLLLSGAFICEVSQPDAFRYLSNDEQQRDANAYLTRIGRKLAVTGLGGAWYAAYDRIGQAEKKAIKEDFAKVKLRIRFIVQFFVKAMRASNMEVFYSRGDKIEALPLIASIDGNPGLRAEFQSLSSLIGYASTDTKLSSMLNRQLKELVNGGYLVVANAEREIYQVTGKIEYLDEVVQFLMTAANVPEEQDEERNFELPLL